MSELSVATPAARADVAVARLGLGTVQFGLPYGLARPQRVIEQDEVARILSRAWEAGVDLIDTAAAYGESESVIGMLRPPAAAFSIVSKTLPVRSDRITPADVERVVAGVHRSLALLRISTLDALLVHESNDLLVPGGDALFAALVKLKSAGLVKRLGVSVYEPPVLDILLGRFPIEIVQLPLNVFDQRFVQHGRLAQWAARGVEIHARSVFLQGLLIRVAGDLPPRLAGVAGPLARFHDQARRAGLDPVAAALGFAIRQSGVACAVVGVDGFAAFEANLQAYAMARRREMDFAGLAVDDTRITDPRQWSS